MATALSSNLTEEQTLSVVDANKEATLPEHLVALPGGEWALWRSLCLRGAGFPAAQVLKLSSPECAAAADQLLDAEDERERIRHEALAEVNKSIDDLRSTDEWENKAKRAPLVSALQALKAGKILKPLADESPINALFEKIQASHQRVSDARAGFREAYLAGVSQVSSFIRELIEDDKFSEAVIWQNRHAYHSVWKTIERGHSNNGARSSKQRQSEELIASYLQRYSVKNDSIGFFGPIGWGRLNLSLPVSITVSPGPHLLATRNVYFEGWGIDALAAKLMSDEDLLRWATPRRVPYIRIEAKAYYLPKVARPFPLTPPQATVLRACDNKRTAKEVAMHLVGDTTTGFKSEEEVYKLLGTLRDRGLITWTFLVPLGPQPERSLQKMLERIEPAPVREPALAALTEIESARQRVALAAGDSKQLDEALGALEETFTRLTSVSAKQAEGQTYAARTLVYEDGRRDVDLEIGPEILETLAPPLSLILASARWVSGKIAELYRQAVEAKYLELVSQTGNSTIEAIALWLAVESLIFDVNQKRPLDMVQPLFQERWAKVFSLPPDVQRIQYKSEELLPRVRALFEAAQPGWKQACYHSPDVMIVAESVEAIRRGEYELVLGELHFARNTLGAALFVAQHPAPEELLRYVTIDYAKPKLSVIIPKSWTNETQRTIQVLIPKHDYELEVAHDAICPEGLTAIPIEKMVVEKLNGQLILRTRDKKLSFDIMEMFGEPLSLLAVNLLHLLPRQAHTPRVTIDRLIVAREAWSFPVVELKQFVYLKDEAERFLAIRRWARAHGIPRLVFIKVPIEIKPLYVDFSSTIYVDVFIKQVRRTIENNSPEDRVNISEMIPNHEQTWLQDAAGQKYTSELRVIVYDRSLNRASPGTGKPV
jgi:hypothetical protein